MRKILYLFFATMISVTTYAQDSSLLKMLNDSMTVHQKPFYVTGTFKAGHIVNTQTIEQPGGGALNFVIQHRFGQLNSGAYNFFGLDNATLRLGLDYGISDRFAAGVGRSTYEKTYDGYLKYKLLRQTDATNKMPVSVSAIAQITYYTLKYPEKPYLTSSDRLAYTAQLLIARKFNRNLSIQLTPTYLHYNLVPTPGDKNNIFALAAGGRMKITRRMSINVEYNYLPSGQINAPERHDSFSLGWDIETGGHVFQLVFSNSQSMIETQYITQTTGRWGNGDIYFGFNISRNFNVSKKAKNAKKS